MTNQFAAYQNMVPQSTLRLIFIFVAIVAVESNIANLLFAQSNNKNSHQDLSFFLGANGERIKIESVADWMVRREQILANVKKVMGELPPRTPLPLKNHIIRTEERDGIRYEKIAYQADSSYELQAWLLAPIASKIPDDAKLRPGVLCLHQTVGIGKDEPVGLGGSPNLHYAKELALRGFITLSPDYPSLGEHEYNFEQPKDGPKYESGSMKAIVDNRRALDILQGISGVDPSKIGCIGHSLGGHNSIFTAIFDERIRAVVSCCGFTRFHKYYEGNLKGWSGPRYMPRIEKEFQNNPDRMPFDFGELIAVLAPRPFLAVAPVRDANFEVSGVRDVFSVAHPIYDLFHASTSLQARYPDCEHDFPKEDREAAYLFLESSLR